jgi:thiol-disulfide isomerase/thioredoxin
MGLRMNSLLPDLNGATRWFNTDEGRTSFSADELKGSPTLIHFWSVSCHTCHEIANQVQAWKNEWEPHGVKFISVHQAKNESDLDLKRIEADIQKMGMTQPVAADNDFKIIDAFSNEFMPAFYLFDSEGKMRHFQAGDRGFDRLLDRMGRLVKEEKEKEKTT